MEASGYTVGFADSTYVKFQISGNSQYPLENPITYYALHLEPFEKLIVSNTTATLTTHNPNNFTIN